MLTVFHWCYIICDLHIDKFLSQFWFLDNLLYQSIIIFIFLNMFLKFFKKFQLNFISVELFIKLLQFIISNWLFFSAILSFLLIFSSSTFFSNFIHIIFINSCIMNCNADMMKLMWLNNNLFSFHSIILFVFMLYLIFISYMCKHSIQFIRLKFSLWFINIMKQLIIFLINSK